MFERWTDRGSRETGKFFSQPVCCGAKRLQLLSLSFLSLSPHAQTGAVVLSQRTYSSWPASLGVHRYNADWEEEELEELHWTAIRHRIVEEASSNQPFKVAHHQCGMIYVIKLSFAWVVFQRRRLGLYIYFFNSERRTVRRSHRTLLVRKNKSWNHQDRSGSPKFRIERRTWGRIYNFSAALWRNAGRSDGERRDPLHRGEEERAALLSGLTQRTAPRKQGRGAEMCICCSYWVSPDRTPSAGPRIEK